jgi:hypothetical protein
MSQILINEQDLYQLLISEFRYAVKRDNHLAPSTCVQRVMTYLPSFSQQWRSHIAYQLTDEIITERIFGRICRGKLKYDDEWEKLLVFLTDYLTSMPPSTVSYMERLYNDPHYSTTIDYYSAEITEQIQNNQAKNYTN